jgi:2-polyprenyl-3-methyl-5-hydroxy-6-metoxy-1,4-benzoquinol methylase
VRLLDVGAGSGALSERLLDAGYLVTASDRDAADYVGRADFQIWDVLQKPPWTATPFDAVCAVEVLEHVDDPAEALRNIHGTLKPGGCLIVTTPNLGHPKSRLKFLIKGAPSYFGPSEFDSLGHRTLLPPWMLERRIRDAGFDIASTSYAGLLGGNPLWRLSSLFQRPKSGDGAITVVTARKVPG